MIELVVSVLVVGYLPGALIFRLPIADRPRRAALDAAERVFWAVVISLTITLVAALGLAAIGRYTFQHLLITDAIVAAFALAAGRGGLRMNGAARPDLWTAAPIGLVALSLWSFPPPAEYVLGGKDPGVYFNAGIQIAQRGRLVVHDPLVASLPPLSRDLFFPQHIGQAYYSTRFMGFFLLDPLTGAVVDQFPHLYPTAVAIGYGLAGVTGARYTPVACAIAGVLALYFLGARLAGRAAGAGAGGLLAIHLVQVWHARVPNSEILAQPLLLAGLLALAHAHQDVDGFFAPIAGVLLGLLPFARFDGVLAVVLACAGLALYWVTGGRMRWGFVLPLGAGLLLFVLYLATWLAPYAAMPISWMTLNRRPLMLLLAGAIAALGAGLRLRRSQPVTSAIRRWLPHAMTVVVAALAAYAWFVRQPGGALAVHDAWSLRQFSWYVHPAAIAAALAGLAILAPRAFWRDPAFFTVACGSAIFVFHRIRIVPEHFWASRRYVAIILPAVLFGIATTLLLPLAPRPAAGERAARAGRYALRLVVLALVAWTFATAASRIHGHVEYAGVIPRLEAMAARFTSSDVLIVESRNASDVHVLALPLAYIYDRSVLVLNSPKPDKAAFAEFLAWARSQRRDVYFIGGGGTDLLSREIAVKSVASERFQVPEYESPPNAYPTHVRFKEFDFGIYRFAPPTATASEMAIDVGDEDDLQVVRFHAKERDERGTYRWTRGLSYLSLVGLPENARELVLWMDNGGRPAQAPPAEVEAFIGEVSLGRVAVGPGMHPYAVPIPPQVAAAAAGSTDAITVRLRTTTWNPREVLQVSDDRDLGVMVDRVEIRRGP
jgi:hypothetical protein